jgi:hypothetical protein
VGEVFAITRMNCSVAIKVGYWPCYCVREARATTVIDDDMRASSMVRALLEGIRTLTEGDTGHVYDYGKGISERGTEICLN